MKLAAVGIASVLLLLLLRLAAAAVTIGDGVTIEAINNAGTTSGGQRFQREYGLSHAEEVLAASSNFAWQVFGQTDPADRRPVDHITLEVEAMDAGVPYPAITHVSTHGSNIVRVNAGFVNDYTGDLEMEMTGVLCHETAHVWQWGMQDYKVNTGIFEGIADYVRLQAGYARATWVQPGQGDRWDQGYDVTARFLDYCNWLQPGFVALLNEKLKDGYDEDYFRQILGEDVQQVWQNYKAAYAQ